MIHPIADNPILECVDLSWPWVGIDPFLLCAHHIEHYPSGDAQYAVPLEHRQGHPAGKDYANPDGYSLYAGADGMPGFPNHPHRGMETVSILRRGFIDHADSLGNSGRYGPGDVQWMTAGGGIQHAEMFPLLHQDQPNEFELFQVWLNMPGHKKMVGPSYKMMWAEQIPHYRHEGVNVHIVAGGYQPQEDASAPFIEPLSPTPDTWAADPQSELAIWVITIAPGARITLPPATRPDSQRTLFAYEGNGLLVAGQDVGANRRVRVVAQAPLPLSNRSVQPVQLMLMQGVPLGEPVIRSTVYVTNTIEELHQAKRDFQRTGFGGWPWETRQPMHGPGFQRFAQYAGHAERELP
ncbi:pirin family protein [Diaphorobacter sp. HDW4A]|uniref:pirin family protein n=1 Tax=Diaphorobacter sp. HDW4A TaxID=2714924 RepID=UPI001409E8E5|nr:pirin family protein [Diaphorobacter sp. HDW4A]QIL79653.1 pirin family protein [Diaphorobacter sp. HDW4A]